MIVVFKKMTKKGTNAQDLLAGTNDSNFSAFDFKTHL